MVNKYMNATNENSVQKFGFTIRGQEFVFNTREDYQEAFSKALDIATEQQDKYIDRQRELERVESRREAAGDYVTEEAAIADEYEDYGLNYVERGLSDDVFQTQELLTNR